jgi:hypothetical protein
LEAVFLVYNGLVLRHEYKYYIPYADYMAMRGRIASFMTPDSNMGDTSGYHVRSLYFDDAVMSARFEKVNGYKNRSKTRIRVYNKNMDFVRLEKKIKLMDMVGKRTAVLTAEELQAAMGNDQGALLRSDKPVVQRFYADMKLHRLRPVVMVDYRREAYMFRPGNVRVTFDHDLQASYGVFDPQFSDRGLIRTHVYPPQMLAMEVKFDDFLPAAVKRLIRPYTARRSAISKYVLALDAARIGERYGGVPPTTFDPNHHHDPAPSGGDHDLGHHSGAVHLLHL